MKAVFYILFFGIVCFAQGAHGVVAVDLTGDGGHLEFVGEDFSFFEAGGLDSKLFGPSGILFDIDRDGNMDWIRSNFGYICGVGIKKGNHVTFYQTNMPPEYCRTIQSSFGLRGDLDLDGDGRMEIVVTGHTKDRFRWGFWVLDPHTGEKLTFFELDGHQEIRPDGLWDGNYSVVGMVPYSDDGTQRNALVLSVNVGFDLEGRGVLAVDPWSGEILWRFLTGPNPLDHSTDVVDLDKDGQPEILVYGRAPDNLGGVKINGYTDNESRLFALNGQGELLWTKRLGGWYGGGYLITSDLNGDGTEEIITTTNTTPEVWGELAVWSLDGQCLARTSVEDQLQNLLLIPEHGPHGKRLVVSSSSGLNRVFEFTGSDLRLVATLDTEGGTFLNCVADILPPPGPEIILTTRVGTTWIIGHDFQPLARVEVNPKSWHQVMMPWEPEEGTELLMRASGPGHPMVFARAPAPSLNMVLASVVGGTVLVFLAGFVFWKKNSVRRLGDPTVLREVRLNLLEDLELSNHGAIAPLKCLRRLIWHLNAMNSGLGDNESIEVRLRETWTESMENALPHLAGILDRARLAGLSGANVEFAARSLDKIKGHLEVLEKEAFQVSGFTHLTAELTSETARADDALKDLRQEVAGFFHTDLAATVTRVLRANSQAIEENDIQVQAGFLAQMAAGGNGGLARGANPAVTCLIDPPEMDFVMDNLVANAVRAMAESSQRSLAVTWSGADGMVTVDVRDTGCGIPAEHRSRIMETNFSTREGGGYGLPRSRKILRKYGGGLMILDTSVGHGTTFRVTLPAAD